MHSCERIIIPTGPILGRLNSGWWWWWGDAGSGGWLGGDAPFHQQEPAYQAACCSLVPLGRGTERIGGTHPCFEGQNGLDTRGQSLCSQREASACPLCLFLAWAATLSWGGGTQKSEIQWLRLPWAQCDLCCGCGGV